MAQQLQEVTAIVEGLGLVPSTQQPAAAVPEYLFLTSGLCGNQTPCVLHIYISRYTHMHIKQIFKIFSNFENHRLQSQDRRQIGKTQVHGFSAYSFPLKIIQYH